MSHDEFHLTLPSRTEHLGTARSFAAAVARHYAITGEAVEDLKIAVSEACVDALVAGEPISVSAVGDDSAVGFSIAAPETGDAPGRAALDELGAPARIELIRTLFPDAALAEDESGRRSIQFSVPTP